MNANEIKHYAMYQGPMTNNFLSMLYLRPSSINSLTGEAKICSGDFTMYIDNYELHMQSEVFVMKIFDFFTVLFTGRYGYRKDEPFDIISYSLKNIALIFGIKKTEASANMLRVKIKRAFELLKSVSLEWKESSKNRKKEFTKMCLCDIAEIRDGVAYIKFSNPFACYLTHSYVMWFPNYLFMLDERNPISYILGRKLLLHYGIDNNATRGTNNKIKMEYLLHQISFLPTINELWESDRHYKQRIIIPVQKGLSKLLEFIGIWFIFRNQSYNVMDFCKIEINDFLKGWIVFQPSKFPSQGERIFKKEKKQKEREEKWKRKGYKYINPKRK